MTFEAFFREVTGSEPYPYQRRLGYEEWPDVVDVPTGLGKTAAVALAWLYRRRVALDGDTPRRLVWCLPMRSLVEQTRSAVEAWLERAGALGNAGELDKVAVHTLMGGEPAVREPVWAAYPEQEAVLIGTQDMLLSRALMRGYGMSRYQWPVHFALLHNDALWVFDEVQLMGPGVATSAQLEAFRRDDGVAAPARSMWMSATLRQDWLNTVDFRRYSDAGLRRLALTDADEAEPGVSARVHAPKQVQRASAALEDASKAGRQAYIEALADELVEGDPGDEQILVIVNRVERAQALYDALVERGKQALLVHARFRPGERVAKHEALEASPAPSGRIVVATQAVEAGLDLDSTTLYTELAPWSSLVQRFGRCNRAGRYPHGRIRWINVDEQASALALPYGPQELAQAREILAGLSSAAPSALPAVMQDVGVAQVVRRRDFAALFDTDPDLSGFDVDVSPFIRDVDTPPVQVFWRAIADEQAAHQPEAARDEICPAAIGQLKSHLNTRLGQERRKAVDRSHPVAWRLDTLGGGDRGGRWNPVRADELRPGQTVMLAAGDGGYDIERGFVAGLAGPVPATPTPAASEPAEGFASDPLTTLGRRVHLAEHARDVASAASDIADTLALSVGDRGLLETAAWWHDVGKAHAAFQRGIGFEPEDPAGPWAKSASSDPPRFHTVEADGTERPRPGFRHELASMLAWLEAGEGAGAESGHDLVAYLIAAHHGRVRMGLRALPIEAEPPTTDTLYARGVWAGDRLPPLDLGEVQTPRIRLRLDLMRLGTGAQGPSWSERTRRLLTAHGPFRLAWLETLVRVADWRASAREAQA